MPADFSLSVVAPDRSVVEERVTSVTAPGEEGYLGVWAGHEPLIAGIKTGVLEYTDSASNRRFVAIGGGFAEVTPERVTILADSAELATEIDASEAERTLEEARKALRGESSTMSKEEATREIELAMSRIRAARMR